jgi:hypothetical protein
MRLIYQIKRRDLAANTAPCMVGPGFKSWPNGRLSSAMIIYLFLSFLTTCEETVKFGHINCNSFHSVISSKIISLLCIRVICI